MDAKAAAGLAKDHISYLFEQEGLSNLGLEEVEYDDTRGQWRVTVGFSRSWDQSKHWGHSIGLGDGGIPRTYKIVIIDKDGKALSVKNREPADAG
jgi:hypothetical protein